MNGAGALVLSSTSDPSPLLVSPILDPFFISPTPPLSHTHTHTYPTSFSTHTFIDNVTESQLSWFAGVLGKL